MSTKEILLSPGGLVELMDQPRMRVLIIDEHRCGFSRALMEELGRAVPLGNKPTMIYKIDLGLTEPTLWADTWVPGVPCMVSDGALHLGVDAFQKMRELARSIQGIKLVEIPS